jgi:hypothetical protein
MNRCLTLFRFLVLLSNSLFLSLHFRDWVDPLKRTEILQAHAQPNRGGGPGLGLFLTKGFGRAHVERQLIILCPIYTQELTPNNLLPIKSWDEKSRFGKIEIKI